MHRAALLALLLAACQPTDYRPYDDDAAASEAAPWERRVRYEVTGDLLRDPPACAVVAAAPAGAGTLGAALEAALARQLTQRLPWVLMPLQRRRLQRDLALDLGTAEGRRWFAAATGCAAVLDWQVTRNEDAYAVVWAHRAIGLEAALRRADGTLLWRAAHDAWRFDGGLPLSPVSALTATAAAARLSGDPELADSMADDLARRLFATLPDLR